MMDGNTLMTRVGGGADQVNLMEIVSYLRESKLARKVSGYAESQAELAIKKGKPAASHDIRDRIGASCL